MVTESQAVMLWLDVLTKSNVVVIVCTESQPNVLIVSMTITPVSAGSHDAVSSKVESDNDIPGRQPCRESQVSTPLQTLPSSQIIAE